VNGPEFLPPLPPRSNPAVELAPWLKAGGRGAALAALEASGGFLLSESPTDGAVRVTFARAADDDAGEQAVILLLDTLTHLHRNRLRHFLLERIATDEGDLQAISLDLPRGLRCTAAFLLQERFDPSVAAERSSWAGVCSRTVELAGTGEVLRSAGGGRASVLTLPGASPSGFVELAGEDKTFVVPAEHAIDSAALGVRMRVWAGAPVAPGVPSPSEPHAVALLSDGDRLTSEVPVLGALAAAQATGALAPTLTLLFAPEDPSDRFEVLGMNPGLAAFIERELLPWAARSWELPSDPDRYLVTGASLGGLAAADVVRRAPDLVANALVQSGSFWWPSGDPDLAEGEQLRLWADAGPGLAGRVRLFHEVGSQEGHLRGINREFRALAAAAGVEVNAREYEGGHDFVCWRVGIIDALVQAFPGPLAADLTRHGIFTRLSHQQEQA
jgi:enterochelin esterase-like enzyme